MKILWLCNVPLPIISIDMSEKVISGGGWLTGLANAIRSYDNIELSICFPTMGQMKIGEVDKIKYFAFPKKIIEPHKYDPSVEKYMTQIIEKVKPDIVHIFGTEFPHTLAMTKVFNRPEKTIINIQGLCSVIEKHYYANLESHIVNRYTFRDFLKRDTIKKQREKFIARGKFEIEAINNVSHISGRTSWDRACTSQINPEVQYHFCQEILRDEFYNHEWNIDQCEKYSIFISQATYPIKGLHFVIKALAEVIKSYPAAHLYIAGPSILPGKSLKERLKVSSYGKYIKQLIDTYGLQSHITFTGDLAEEEMCKRFLRTHVFVSASSIENSSNSVGEAMLLGVPTISSDVGGIKDMLTHNVDGIIYQHDAYYMLAYHIVEIFKDKGLALKLSKNAKVSARNTYDKENNINTMLNIYNRISLGINE